MNNVQEDYQEQYSPEDMQQQQQEDAFAGSVATNNNPDLMRFLFNFHKEVLYPLRKVWEGHVKDHNDRWILQENHERIMNDEGISWCMGRIESYINSIYVVSNYDEKNMNWTLRVAGKSILNSLCLNYKRYALKKHNIPVVYQEIISKIHAILLGARGDGYRKFFSSTTNVSEIRNNNNDGGGRGFMREFFNK